MTFDHEAVVDEVVLDPELSHREFYSIEQELILSVCKLSIFQSELYKINETIVRLE